MFNNRYRIIHFVGIGGIGMSGIAEVLHNLGYDVTGSDIRESDTTTRLRGLGIKIAIGHKGENLDSAHVVVISSAVSSDNPEVIEARKRNIPVIPRAEMLAELGRLKYGVLIAGAHGKTTTTSLVATLLSEGGLDPTVIIGGKLKSMGSNAKLGQGDYLVAEADESDGSFLKLSPAIAVITNIDREHMDFFKTMDALKQAFVSFINKIPFYGTAIVCKEDPYVREIIPMIQRRVVTYGLSDVADIYARDIRSMGVKTSFEAVFRGQSLGQFTIPIPGLHNVLNSLAAIATALELQVPLGTISSALGGFSGIQRRFEPKGEAEGVKVFDDYGHHPSEIAAVLKAARQCFSNEKLCVLFQPHRYTRTMDLMNEFASCLASGMTGMGRLFLMDIYAAGERPIDGVSSEVLTEKIRERGFPAVTHIHDRQEMLREVSAALGSGGVLLTLGAGDVYKVGEELLRNLKGSS
ncbi:MAG: UDP-N-acetylmuramate--L-alanine ligase [Nitrospirales bacterium]|nr:UDP-N-acetylmuramate--L-alanine ligase [Nitrospirales bacterium]